MPRIKFTLEEGSTLILLAHDLGGLTPEAFIRHWTNQSTNLPADRIPDGIDLKQDGVYFERFLITDAGCNVRVVVDDALTPEESENWVAHARGRLNLRDGKLLIFSTYEWYEFGWLEAYEDAQNLADAQALAEIENPFAAVPKTEDGRRYETSTCLPVPPGLYRMDIYGYLPDITSIWHESFSEVDGYPANRTEELEDYWERTHPREPLPDWIDRRENEYIDFVLQLTPIDQQTFDSFEMTDIERAGEWELRKPDICPAALLMWQYDDEANDDD